MSKKTLEEKIKRVCWWAVGLTILYFLIGAWLISDGPNIDPSKTYDLLKDTLTLTATFLAPVAAFVLFSDWREPYLAGVKDEMQTRLIALEYDIRRLLFIVRIELSSQKLNEEEYKVVNEELFEKMIDFKNNIKRLDRLGFVESVYVKNMKEIYEHFQTLKQSLDYIYYFVKKSLSNEADKELLKFDERFKIVQEFAKNLDAWDLELSK